MEIKINYQKIKSNQDYPRSIPDENFGIIKMIKSKND